MKKGLAILDILVWFVLAGLTIGAGFLIFRHIVSGTEDIASISHCAVGLQDGRCELTRARGTGFECVQAGCDGGYCCYCTDPSQCFGGAMFIRFGSGKMMDLRFEENTEGNSHLALEVGTLERADVLDADGGLSNDRPFTIRYMPQAEEFLCELSITDDSGATKNFGEQNCESDDFIYLAGQGTPLMFNEIEDDSGNEICTPTEDDTCKVTFALTVDGSEKESFIVYFER